MVDQALPSNLNQVRFPDFSSDTVFTEYHQLLKYFTCYLDLPFDITESIEAKHWDRKNINIIKRLMHLKINSYFISPALFAADTPFGSLFSPLLYWISLSIIFQLAPSELRISWKQTLWVIFMLAWAHRRMPQRTELTYRHGHHSMQHLGPINAKEENKGTLLITQPVRLH